MNPNQIKRMAHLLRDVKSSQEETLAPLIEENLDNISNLEQSVNSISETLDVYFWTLVRANLDGLFSGPEEGQSEEEYRKTLLDTLIGLQYEYLACQSLADFFSSL